MPQLQRPRAGKTGRPEPIMEPMTAADGVDFEIIELFFFAYRAFTSDPDAILEMGDMGRAHHRVMHFVNREPGMTVAALLETLKITKQSLARVLKQLIDKGYICQIAGPEDRRQRCLYPTRAGRDLALELAAPQHHRIAHALATATPEERAQVVRFLTRMCGEEEGGKA